MEINMPRLEIKSYYTIMLNGYYLDTNILFYAMPIYDIPNHLTKNIGNIPNDLLFKDYEKAYNYMRHIWEAHYIMRLRKDKLEVVKINKSEEIKYDKFI